MDRPARDPGLDPPTAPQAFVSATEHGLAVYLEQRASAGEDAFPTGLEVGGRSVVAVYDGLGGAGASRRLVDGGEYTDAAIAARLAKGVVEHVVQEGRPLEPERLHDDLLAAFGRFGDRFPATTSRVRSGMVRVLPTTLAIAEVVPDSAQHRVRALWAGDSRVYLLDPHNGLRQLTVDHVRDPDPLRQLVGDGPLLNVASQDRPFRIDEHEVLVDSAFLVLAATDGIFGYVRTPGEVEHHLLHALVHSTSMREAADRLAGAVRAYTGDDATLALRAIGFGSFARVTEAFRERAEVVRRDQHEPVAATWGTPDLPSTRDAAWDRYRHGYLSAASVPGG